MDQDSAAADDGANSEKPSETVSQFVARVLNQLSLAAWLPSGALVLALTFVFELNTVLDGKVRPKDASDAISSTFSSMARLSLGGGLLLFSAVIVLTILTQVFAFDAILMLRGFWGTLRVVEWAAKRRCMHFSHQYIRLEKRYSRLNEKAWNAARSEIEKQQTQAIDRQADDARVREWTPGMLSYLGAVLTDRITEVKLSPGERGGALKIPWHKYAPPDLLRRQINLDRRRQDFPALSRIMPTRLGNILRAYEDRLDSESIPTFVLDIYDHLPPHLRAQHHEWRNRLDLYCSMVFVIALITVVAATLLGPQHWQYSICSALAGVLAMWLAYQAAIATARTYGRLLISMKKYRLSGKG